MPWERTPVLLNRRMGGPRAVLDTAEMRKIACLYWESKPHSLVDQHLSAITCKKKSDFQCQNKKSEAKHFIAQKLVLEIHN
jgi:hypothetical protein